MAFWLSEQIVGVCQSKWVIFIVKANGPVVCQSKWVIFIVRSNGSFWLSEQKGSLVVRANWHVDYQMGEVELEDSKS